MKYRTLLLVLLSLCVAGWIVYLVVEPNTSPSISANYSNQCPIGPEIRIEHPLKDGTVTLSSRVTHKENGYLYQYQINYQGNTSYLYRWEVLERAFGKEIILDLDSNSTHTFSVLHPAPPVFIMGKTDVLKKESVSNSNMTATIWQEEETTSQIGPIPN